MDTPKLEAGSTDKVEKKVLESTTATTDPSVVDDLLPPVDRGWHAWVFVIAATTLETFVWGWGLTFGTFQEYYTSSPDSPEAIRNSSISAIAAIGTTYLAVQYLLGFAIMPLLKRYPQHITKALWAFLVIECASLIGASFAAQTWQLILFQGIIPGTTGAVFYGPTLLWLAEWFVERRGLAGGILFSGTGLGGAVFPPIVGVVLQRLGFRWTLRIWAAVFTVVMGIVLIFVRPRHSASSMHEKGHTSVDWSKFGSPMLIVVSAAVFIQALGYFPISVYIPTYTTSIGNGLPPLDGQLVLSVFNLFTLIGQVLLGYLCDISSFNLTIVLSGIGSALSAFLLWGFADNLGMVFAFVVVFGITAGGFSSIFTPVGSAVFGADSLSAGVIPGYLGALRGIAAIVGPLISANLYNPGEPPLASNYGLYGYGKMEMFVGAMTAATIVAGLASWVLTVRERRRARQT